MIRRILGYRLRVGVMYLSRGEKVDIIIHQPKKYIMEVPTCRLFQSRNAALIKVPVLPVELPRGYKRTP